MILYRREIDGLRALAVLPVIFYHAGFTAFGGGYVGVDVFFVISGYLITSLILAEKEEGSFSIVKFYERRARRILPALFLVLFACIPFAWLWLLPSDLTDFSASLAAVTGFVSNILFWQESGYFHIAAELKPLLHTWSLAVEEQYYLLFPLFIVLTWRLGKGWIVAILVAVAVISLTGAGWGSVHRPEATFFLLPTRGWELLVGSFVAFYFSTQRAIPFRKLLFELGGLAGLGLILYAVFAFSDQTPFPGLYALVPTLGTALVILFARRETLVGKLLENNALVGIGLISYSAYLWHLPLFVFARHRSLDKPSSATYLGLALAAILLAYLSWRFVERPFRDRSRFGRSTIFGAAFLCSVIAASAGMLGYMSDGYLFRSGVRAKLDNLDARLTINRGLSKACDREFQLSSECNTGSSPEVLLWGDSFAMQLAAGLLASNTDLRMIQMTVSMCGPILDVAPNYKENSPDWGLKCIAFNDRVLEWLRKNPSVKYAVLSSPFRQYVGENATLVLRNGEIERGAGATLEPFRKTLAALSELGIRPVVFSPTPEMGRDFGRCIQKARLFAMDERRCDFRLAEADEKQSRVIDFLKKIAAEYEVVWLRDQICDQGVCAVSTKDVVIYRDKGHLSREGSAFLGKKFDYYGLIVGSGALPSAVRMSRTMRIEGESPGAK